MPRWATYIAQAHGLAYMVYLVSIYRAADLVAVPSYNESFGLVALEANSSGGRGLRKRTCLESPSLCTRFW